MQKVTVKINKGYDFFVGEDVLGGALEPVLFEIKARRCAVIADAAAEKYHLDALSAVLSHAGCEYVCYTLAPGERSKSLSEYGEILTFLADNEICRNDVIIALGGGVAGDISGFCAATYMRGIRYINIPTTLLAAVDSSVGGKCAVDLPEGKNLAGAFWQPEAVICDTRFLKTLDEAEIRSGAGEILKYGLLADGRLLSAAASRESCVSEDIISQCVSIKADYVREDETDFGVRRFLNLGHTAAHAAELLSGYTLPHGEAVAYGLSVITHAAEKNNMCESGLSDIVDASIKAAGLPCAASMNYSSADLASAAMGDKKRSGNKITLVIPRSVGKCFLHTMKTDELAEFLACGTGEK